MTEVSLKAIGVNADTKRNTKTFKGIPTTATQNSLKGLANDYLGLTDASTRAAKKVTEEDIDLGD